MKEIILLKYGELVLKGLNKSSFSTPLLSRVKRVMKQVYGDFEFDYRQSTLCIRCSEDADVDAAYDACRYIFGIANICRGIECEKSMDAIEHTLKTHCDYFLGNAKTFKCSAKRADKSFPLTSPEISAVCGGILLQARPHLTVDVNSPDAIITVEVRDTSAFIHGFGDRGAGGLPTGTAGRGLLLLSGGIDSPVAGHMMAKRGMNLDAVYFESPPYTSEAAREKVKSLAMQLSKYTDRLFLHCVSVTEIQETLVNTCEEKLFTLLLRRFMMRIADRVAENIHADCLITGESVGQVASQTVPSLAVTNALATVPVFRPCCGLDKEEIVVRARQIGTFDISVLPYEDCCTVFTPKHPNIAPTLLQLEAEEAKLDVEGLVERALKTEQHFRFDGKIY